MSQYIVNIANIQKPIIDNSNFAVYRLTKHDLERLRVSIGDPAKVIWKEVISPPNRITKRGYHSTAIERRDIPLPLKRYLSTYNPLLKRAGGYIMYHGIGKDRHGLHALEHWAGPGAFVRAYDPHHPDLTVRCKPEYPFDEIFSIYVLNIMDRHNGYEVIIDFINWLTDIGHVIIAVRRDL